MAGQNKVTFDYLESLPYRSEIEERLTTLWNYEKISAPFRVGDVYYFSRNDGLQNQNVLYRMDTLDSEPARPEYVLVELDGQQINLDDPDGWRIEGATVTVPHFREGMVF